MPLSKKSAIDAETTDQPFPFTLLYDKWPHIDKVLV